MLETRDPTSPIELIVFDIFDQVNFDDVEIFLSKLGAVYLLPSASDLVQPKLSLNEIGLHGPRRKPIATSFPMLNYGKADRRTTSV